MEACPLDSRRDVTEVFIKRLAVMFATLCLHGHLNSLRGMKGSSQLPLSILLFFINPIYPLCVIIFDIGWAILKARKGCLFQIHGDRVSRRRRTGRILCCGSNRDARDYDEHQYDSSYEKTSMSILRLAILGNKHGQG